MVRVGLEEYLGRIEGLLEENRLPEAATHCHFILQQYPRHIRTYRLFGRALLEQQLYDDAIDIFGRVISAIPDDVIAHAGLALAYREKHNFAQAIWHMERAFEAEPYNEAILNELRDLYAGRNGYVPNRIELNRPALARLYFQGALYGKAVVELKRLLAEKPERIELQVLLAETYFWDDQRVEAVDQCLVILDQYPYCIKANAILADLWLRNGRFAEAQSHLRQLRALTLLTRGDLDLSTTVGRALATHIDIKLPESIQVDALDDLTILDSIADRSTDWLKAVTAKPEKTPERMDWIQEFGEAQDTEPLSPEDDEDLLWLAATVLADQDSRKVQSPVDEFDQDQIDNSESGQEHSPSVEYAESDLVPELDAFASDLTESDQPPAQEPGFPAYPSEDSEGILELLESDFGEDLLSWSELHEVREEADSEVPGDLQSMDWLGSLADDSEISGDLPDWLYESVGLSDELKTPTDYNLPQWLSEINENKLAADTNEVLQDREQNYPESDNFAPQDDFSVDTTPKSSEWLDDELNIDTNEIGEVDSTEIAEPVNLENQAETIPWLAEFVADVSIPGDLNLEEDLSDDLSSDDQVLDGEETDDMDSVEE